MPITKPFSIENDRRGSQEVCSDCEAYGLKKHGLTRSDSTLITYTILFFQRFEIKTLETVFKVLLYIKTTSNAWIT